MVNNRRTRMTVDRAGDVGIIGGLLYALLICRFDPPLNAAHTFNAVFVGIGLWLAFRWLARRDAEADRAGES